MEVAFEFYRKRGGNGFVQQRERLALDAVNLDVAIGMARALMDTIEQSRRPDTVRILDAHGEELFSGPLDEERPS